MPFDLGALIPLFAGASSAGDFINALSTQKQNASSQDFSREMYERTRKDNLEFWQMTNSYNSPQAQMMRFQQAGLNPNLVYGQGAGSSNAGSIPTPDVQSAQFRTPEWGNALSSAGLTTLNAIYDLDIKQAQVDNLKSQNDVIQQDALLKSAQTKSIGTGEERGRFNLDFEKELRDTSADARREQLRQLKTTTDISINRDAREAAMNSSSIKEAAERMLSLQEQRLNTRLERTRIKADVKRIHAEKARIYESIRQLEKDGVLKDLDIELRKQGIMPQDPMWSRIVGRLLANLFEGNGSFKSTTGNIWNYLFDDGAK